MTLGSNRRRSKSNSQSHLALVWVDRAKKKNGVSASFYRQQILIRCGNDLIFDAIKKHEAEYGSVM